MAISTFSMTSVRVLHVAIISVLTQPSLGIPDSLNSFLEIMRAQVLKEEAQCTNIVCGLDASVQSTEWNFALETLVTYYTVTLINYTEESKFVPVATIHYQPCSLLVFDIGTLFQNSNNYTQNFENWPKIPYAGSVHVSYYFFIMNPSIVTKEGTDTQVMLLQFAKSTRKIQNGFFVLPQQDDVIEVFARNVNVDSLYLTTTYPTSAQKDFLRDRLNFNGEPIVVTVCPICDKALETVEKTGIWDDYLAATLNEVVKYANGTLELSPVFAAPGKGLTLEGEWDGYIAPLIDGSAVFTELFEPSPENLQVLYATAAMFFDNVIFITARPKRLRFSSLDRLIRPLRLNVWIAIALSLGCVFIALEIIIEVYRSLKFERHTRALGRGAASLSSIERSIIWDAIPRHYLCWTFLALVKSSLDQTAITSLVFMRNINGHASKLLVSLWYLALIVIGCAYKSDLTSAIVKPVYTHAPKTFEELVESDYKIGATFYSGVLEPKFNAFNSVISRALKSRIYEYDFLEPDCYIKVVQEKSVCIGTEISTPALSRTFITDIWGRPMYLISKEKLFPLMMNFGVSKLYPSLFVPLNNITLWLEGTGMLKKWRQRSLYLDALKGREAARKSYLTNKMYDGEEHDDGMEVYSTVMIYVQVLALGFLASAASFIIEVFKGCTRLHRSNRFLLANEVHRFHPRVLHKYS